MERHKQAVGKIAAAVRACYERGEPYRIQHGSTNSTRPRPRAAPGQAAPRLVDISSLSDVLHVDRAARTALVEPNVPMDRLVAATLPHGLVPPVVMEFPGITAGGGFAGTAGESSSFRHGFFDQTIGWVEMVLGDGSVVRAEPHGEREDLFRGAAGAVGTLGVTTLMELHLVEAKRFVQTTYHRTGSVAEAVAKVRAETQDPKNDYVDGILFSKDHGVVITGRLTDEKPRGRKPQTFSGAWDPWFYLHAQERTQNRNTATVEVDFVPLAEYLFRYDRAGFWVGASAFRYFRPVPFTRFFRWLLDDFLHTRMLYRALHGSGESARFVVQDLALPYPSAEAFVDYTAAEFDIWPLWLCPLKQTPAPTFHPHTREMQPSDQGASTKEPAPMLNIGLWGWGPRDQPTFVAANRALEAKVSALGGMKWLYAHTYYPEDEFWRLYGCRAWYDALRAKYKATTLPTVWDKVRVDVDKTRVRGWKQHVKRCWPVGGLYGIWKSIRSGDYWLHRRAEWKYKEKDE